VCSGLIVISTTSGTITISVSANLRNIVGAIMDLIIMMIIIIIIAIVLRLSTVHVLSTAAGTIVGWATTTTTTTTIIIYIIDRWAGPLSGLGSTRFFHHYFEECFLRDTTSKS
jgi:hypothetical protein